MTDTGGITIPLFHCIFNNGSITHYDREYDTDLYFSLPNLYAVCIADRKSGKRQLVAGFFVKTSYSHHDSGFVPAIAAAAQSATELIPFLNEKISFLPARIQAPDSAPLSEYEMLDVMLKQYVKFSSHGTA